MKERILCLVAISVISLAATAADWPQWRGPQRTGISGETGLLKVWPNDGPKLLWQVSDLDYGYSTPSVVGDRLYLLSNKGNDDESVRAYDVKDGKQIWSTRLGKVGPNQQMPWPAARSTPTVDGDVLYALGSDGDLACVETATGKIRWQKSLRSDFDGKPGAWAYSESPLVDGDTLVCTPGGEEATIVALNKKTGKLIWKCPIAESGTAAYASAIAIEAAGRKQYVQFLGKALVGVDAKTGKLLWSYSKTATGSPANIPTPVAQGDLVYSAAGYTGGAAVKLEAKGDSVAAAQVYMERGLPNAIGGSVLVDGYLYGANFNGAICVEFATGKIKWQDKTLKAGSFCYADSRLYFHGENGDVALIEATPEAYREKGRFTPPNQPKHPRGSWEKAWTYPVVANGRLYIRDLGALWCYDIRNDSGAK